MVDIRESPEEALVRIAGALRVFGILCSAVVVVAGGAIVLAYLAAGERPAEFAFIVILAVAVCSLPPALVARVASRQIGLWTIDDEGLTFAPRPGGSFRFAEVKSATIIRVGDDPLAVRVTTRSGRKIVVPLSGFASAAADVIISKTGASPPPGGA